MPYTSDKPALAESSDQLRARIPGWGADLDPADRPSYPKERFAPEETGAHWDLPESQPDPFGRERSLEHTRLTPVFGTAQPLHGVSGAIRRLAYARYSEGRAAHWLLLVLGDRVEAIGAHVRSFATLRPDNPVTQTGVLGERGRRPLASRFGRHRADLTHMWLDPLIVVGPWVLALVGAVTVVRRIVRLL
ncbi:hypothetical protein [Microbacterium sp. BK668]|uniref:hypothetical protein n=1 Tax=Microbacterium sp. BK668 TaxID=2512118 RepID=UPI0010610A1F|nr:hypothetical protein [Microbacterium sp. BK668]TDN91697.1 hypothetical protein EV279_1200 [Microbacterium sp. BK668]